MVSVNQHHNNKSRRFLYIVLVLLGIIISLAVLFLTVVIYRTLKSGLQNKSLTAFDSNLTDFYSNRSEQACECEFGATCTEQNECRCMFNCNDNDDQRIEDEITGKWYLNQCQFDYARCQSYYEKRNMTCSSIICSHGAKCVLSDNNLPRCDCPSNCDEYISSDGPVCGSDNRTYRSICELNKRACEIQENLISIHLGECRISSDKKCDAYIQCSSDSRLVCASNLREYSNECVMYKYACQSNINLTKLHDGTCNQHEQHQLREACKTIICLNGKTCMVENGIGVCRCLFNCSLENNQVCASNGLIYRNFCEMEHERCIHGENLVSVEPSYCTSKCNTSQCLYGQCKQQSDGQVKCECQSCSTVYSDQEVICGDNGVTYTSKCLLEYDACTKHIDIKPNHIGQCNNCHNIICPFNGQCRSEQGNYTCVCPARNYCSAVRQNNEYAICASNQELFYSQCEMDIRSCELKTHLYAISPQYCTKDREQLEYNDECGYDEPYVDLVLNRTIECDAVDRCPLNSYCNKQANRCCVKVITAVLPYRLCLSDIHCGRNMICLNGLCQCARDKLMPARKKRECVALLPNLSVNSACSNSPFGCCKDNITISPTFDRQGCPEYCNCHPTGSLQLSCDAQTRFCYCRPAVGGSSCSHCENEYWAFSRISTHNNTGCTPCGCHPYGSDRKDCLQDNGQCSCHSFATGHQCDKCIDVSLTLTDRGCINLNKNRRRQRTCRDITCLFNGICQLLNGHPHCSCQHVKCTNEEQRLMNICASDGRTYKSKCEIKRQQCLKQYEIILIYLGVCGTDEDFQLEEESVLSYEQYLPPIDSKRCVTNFDCGENMVCLSEFCECAKQKYQRLPGPRCITPESIILAPNNTVNSLRRTSSDTCIRRNPCEHRAICQDQSDGSYKCLCPYGWKGRYCTEKIEITIPHFNRQSYFELKPYLSIKYIDLLFASEYHNGLILYSDDKLTGFYFIISIHNNIINIIIHLDHFTSAIQLSDTIELNTYNRLQIQILYNEIRAKLNNGNISSILLPSDISFKNKLYLGGLPDSLNDIYQQFHLDEGFQGCIHELSINGRQIAFNNSDNNAQNIDECISNPCRSISCTRCIPVRTNNIDTYKCLYDDQSAIDQCVINSCEINQQCVNVYPNNHTCICLNCSLNHRYIAAFHMNSYIKHPPLEPLGNTGRFKIEISFLSQSSSGLLIYSEHINSKKGHIKLYIQRKMVIFNLIVGRKSITLSSRDPIELNKWHQCSIEIYGQKLTLILDQESPVISYELFSTNILWPRSFTFIGNLPKQYQSSSLFPFEKFRGAIQKIFLNNHLFNDIRQNAIELFNITEYYGYPCQPNPCSLNRQCHQTELNNYTCGELLFTQSSRYNISLELDGTINTVYSYIPSNLHRNSFDLLLKTKNSFGMIFYIGETSLSFFSRYLSLIIDNGFVQLTAKVDANSSAVQLKSKIRVDDGRWHRVEVERFRRRLILKLDDIHRYQAVLLSTKTDFHPNPSFIYIGGYHRLCSYDEQHCQSYRGCLKNVTIDNNILDLINNEINQNHILKQCHDLNR